MSSAVATEPAGQLLQLSGIDTYYGEIHILQSVDLHIGQGELVCLLGGNASGKSTTLKTILGIVRPRRGTVQFDGHDVTRTVHELPDRQRHGDRAGEPALFGPMTVLENLEMGAYLHGGGRPRGLRAGLHALPAPRGASDPARRARSPAASSRWSRWGGR